MNSTEDRRVGRLFAEWARDPGYVAEYEALAAEFTLVEALVRARMHAKLSQAELAARIGTHQASVSRWEGGRAVPSTSTLRNIAKATGLDLVIDFRRPRPAGDRPSPGTSRRALLTPPAAPRRVSAAAPAAASREGRGPRAR